LRFAFIIVVAAVAGTIALIVANSYLKFITNDSAKATVVASVVTVFGVIFSAMYKEISAYYQERSANINRKWELIFPFIRKHYNPWISSAQSLLLSLKSLDPSALTDEAVTRVLYLTGLFYGYRLRFIVNDGGLILLSSDEEERKVMSAYREIENSYGWAGSKGETPRRVSYLQKLFLSKDKPDNPYVLWTFADVVEKDGFLKESRDKLRLWLTKDNVDNLEKKLEIFISCFKASIEKLYTAWGD